MAVLAASARGDPQAEEILMVTSDAGDLVHRLGQLKRNGSTLLDLAAADPTLVRRWERSTGRTPEAHEQRTFAKLALNLLAAHHARGPPVPHPAVSPVVASSAVVRPAGAKRRKVTYVATLKTPVAQAGKSLARQATRCGCGLLVVPPLVLSC